MVDVGHRDVFYTIPMYVEWKQWVLITRTAGKNQDRARTYLPVKLLKKYEDVDSVPTVIVFNFEAFTAKCTPRSALYDASFYDFDVLSR